MYSDNIQGLFGGKSSTSRYTDLPQIDVQPLLKVIKNEQQDHKQISNNQYGQAQQNQTSSNIFGQFQPSAMQFGQSYAFNSIPSLPQQQQNFFSQQQPSLPQLSYNQAYNPFINQSQINNSNQNYSNYQQINRYQPPFIQPAQISNHIQAFNNNLTFQQQSSINSLVQQQLNQQTQLLDQLEQDNFGQNLDINDYDEDIDQQF
ncbi:hypothetical protein ABPG74_009942 [Tetrahymena malaccensis]